MTPSIYPWTTRWTPHYASEGEIYAKYILSVKPDAKIAILSLNDDDGRDGAFRWSALRAVQRCARKRLNSLSRGAAARQPLLAAAGLANAKASPN
jgi:hypothetical protein